MPPIPQVPQGGERRPILGSEQRVRLGLEHGHGGRGLRRHAPDRQSHRVCDVLSRPGHCHPERHQGDQAVTRRSGREDIPPLPRAADTAVQEHHGRAGPLIDDLHSAAWGVRREQPAGPRLRPADHQTGPSGTRKLPDQVRKELTTPHTACADEPSVFAQLIHPDGVR